MSFRSFLFQNLCLDSGGRVEGRFRSLKGFRRMAFRLLLPLPGRWPGLAIGRCMELGWHFSSGLVPSTEGLMAAFVAPAIAAIPAWGPPAA